MYSQKTLTAFTPSFENKIYICLYNSLKAMTMKKTIYATVILLFTTLTSCSQKEVDMEQLVDRNSVKYEVNNDKSYTGKAISKYTNGQVKIEGYYVNGLQDGLWVEYYKNGTPQFKTHFKEGMYNGTRDIYFEDGSLQVKSTYINDKRHGTYIKNFSNGNPKERSEFNNGKRIGTYLEYFENGNTKISYTKDEHNNFKGDYITYNQDGSIQKHIFYDSSDRAINKGTWKRFWDYEFHLVDIPSTYKSTVSFDDNGKPNTNTVFYYSNGKKYMEGYYSSIEPDVKDGEFKWYYKNGLLRQEGKYINNRKNGVWKLYYKERNMAGTKLCQLAEYKDGVLNGKFEWYNIDYLNISEEAELEKQIFFNYKYGRKLMSGFQNSTGNGGRWWKVEGQIKNGKLDGIFKVWDRNWGTNSLPKQRYKKHIWNNGRMISNSESNGTENYFNADGTKI